MKTGVKLLGSFVVVSSSNVMKPSELLENVADLGPNVLTEKRDESIFSIALSESLLALLKTSIARPTFDLTGQIIPIPLGFPGSEETVGAREQEAGK